MKQEITIEHAINILNQALESDPETMNKLINMRVNCNTALADHPTIQVGAKDGNYSVGMLGILNGIFGIDDNQNGFIAAELDDITGKLIKFRRLK